MKNNKTPAKSKPTENKTAKLEHPLHLHQQTRNKIA
jgi:hypothetical protein